MSTPDQEADQDPAVIPVALAPGLILTPDGVPVDRVAVDVLDRLIGALIDEGADPEGITPEVLCEALTRQLSAAQWNAHAACWAVEAFTVTGDDGVTSVSLVVETDERMGRVLLFGVRN